MWAADLVFLGALAVVAATPDANLPDPTRPYRYTQAVEVSSIPESAGAQQWQLGGIQVRDGVKRAILNGRLVKEGQQVGDATVTTIGTSDLTLSVGNRLVVLRLLIAPVKQDVAAVNKQEAAGDK